MLIANGILRKSRAWQIDALIGIQETDSFAMHPGSWFLVCLVVSVCVLLVDAQASLVLVDRQISAELLVVVPGNPGSATALVSWPAFDNMLEGTGGISSVEAYEVQYAVSGSGDWKSLGGSLTGLLIDSTTQATEPVPKQRIFTRADDGEVISDGYFRLTLSYEGSSPSVLGGRPTAGVVTPPIAFDASASAMKAAIESLEQITKVQVFRNALDANGAFEWVVLFDEVAYDTQDPLPLLALYTETLSAKWTPSEDQVAVQYLRAVPSFPEQHRRICSETCSYEVELQTGKTFTFRVRAQYSYDIGWSSWSAMSKPLEIPATRLPRAPSAPELLGASTSHVTVAWRMRRDLEQERGIFAIELFPVTSFHAQQQCDDEVGWTTISERIAPGFSGNEDTFLTSAASLDRPPGSTCIFRVAATTLNGQGPFSVPSAKFTTLRTAPGPATNVRIVRDPLTVLWRAPAVLGGHALNKLRYEVEYRDARSSTWTRLPASLVDNSRRAANISLASLKVYTTYIARVRAVAVDDQAGTFSESPEFLTNYAVESDSENRRDDSSVGTRQVVIGASRQQVASKQDWYYVQLTGNGGSGGFAGSGDRAKPGEDGVVLIFPITWSGERLSERTYFFTGGVQTYRVPDEQQDQQYERHLALRIVALDIYAWGAGGAGATASRGASSDLSNGGGGSFVRGLIRVNAGDMINILVGGGGQEDGRGGYNGGGNGGSGDFAGGGGGGASEVQLNERAVLVAAGGAGAGSTDYCCAHGGGGGGFEQAEAGLSATGSSIPLDLAVSGQGARDEYHSSNVAGDTRDFEGLPARHQHLDWGFAANADYSVLATGGTGASPTAAGLAGNGGSYQYSLEGECVVNSQTSLMNVMISPLFASRWPSNGQRGRGGSGQSGKQGGGGGGGGYYGGGGGGAGVDGAGGGGGSSFVSFGDLFNSSKIGLSDASLRLQARGESIRQLSVSPLTSSSVRVTWKAPRYGFSQLVDGFVVEMANRSANEDFRIVRLVTRPSTDISDNNGNLTIRGLAARAAYRFRVKPLLLDGHGMYSEVASLHMPAKPMNTWHRCVTRTYDEESTRAGMRFTNTPPLQRLPSARRGHTLTVVDNFLYLFGGLAKSYECNRAHKTPCLLQQQPRVLSNELWRYDLVTETWWQVPQPAVVPSPREKHSMAVVNGRLLLFGGRKNDVPDPIDASTWGPQAFNDLWELSVSSTTAKQLSVPLDSHQPTNLAIPDGGEVFALGKKSASSSGEQLCVAGVSVIVQVTHACPHKLRLQLFGPGPATFPGRQQSVHFPVDSQARETTWSDSQGLGKFQGDRRATGTVPNTRAFPVLLQSPEEAADKIACSSGTKTLTFLSTANGAGTSLESLSVFHELPVEGNWTLELADTAADGLVGTLDSWGITFDVAPCVPAFTWTDLTAIVTGTAPTPRFQHSIVVFRSSMFVFGGTRGGTGLDLNDLFRLDYTPGVGSGAATAKWTQLASLTESDSPSIAERRVHAGRITLLTPYELMVVGRGLTPPRRTSLGSNKAVPGSRFESQLDFRLKNLEDMIDGWQTLAVGPADSVNSIDEQLPVPRYWGASTFVLSPPGNSPPRVFLFGGQDDTTLLDDLWSLDLAQLNEDFPPEHTKEQRLRVCAWRQENSIYKSQWTTSCGASTTAAVVSACTLEMLLLYAWCEEFYQSVLL